MRVRVEEPRIAYAADKGIVDDMMKAHQAGTTDVDNLWSPYGIGRPYIFSRCGLVFFFLLSFPRLISAAADWMSAILPHMVWP